MVETGSNAASTTALMANVKGGDSAILAGNTSVTFPHGIAGGSPTGVSVTPSRDSTGVDIWEDDTLRDATNITVKTDFAQAADIHFTWTAIR